jgi:hypothetical protein
MHFIDILQQINKQLSIIAENVSTKDYLSDIIPWGLGLISSSVGAIIMYVITSKQEKNKFIRDSHIEYMKLTNTFLSEINKIITSIVNIQKMGFLLIGDINNPDLYQPYFYGNLGDYLLIANKIRTLRKTVDGLPDGAAGVYTSKEHYKEQIIILSDDILNFNKIINVCSEYEKEVMNYYYFIDKNLRKEHADIINMISKATKENMKGFNIENLKKILVEHIQKTNELILGHKVIYHRHSRWLEEAPLKGAF